MCFTFVPPMRWLRRWSLRLMNGLTSETRIVASSVGLHQLKQVRFVLRQLRLLILQVGKDRGHYLCRLVLCGWEIVRLN